MSTSVKWKITYLTGSNDITPQSPNCVQSTLSTPGARGKTLSEEVGENQPCLPDAIQAMQKEALPKHLYSSQRHHIFVKLIVALFCKQHTKIHVEHKRGCGLQYDSKVTEATRPLGSPHWEATVAVYK